MHVSCELEAPASPAKAQTHSRLRKSGARGSSECCSDISCTQTARTLIQTHARTLDAYSRGAAKVAHQWPSASHGPATALPKAAASGEAPEKVRFSVGQHRVDAHHADPGSTVRVDCLARSRRSSKNAAAMTFLLTPVSQRTVEL